MVGHKKRAHFIELFKFYCWPTRTRTLNKTTKMSCVTITPSAKTVNSGAKVIEELIVVKLSAKKIIYFLTRLLLLFS